MKILIYSLFILLNFNSVSISQKPFITTWNINTYSKSITIPTFNGDIYNYNVDWGDGTNNSGYSGDATHTYTNVGKYQVSITGDFPRIYFKGTYDFKSRQLISIDQWGDQIWTSMSGAFYNCIYLAGQAIDRPNLSIVTSLDSMFINAESFNQDIGNWDVSNVTRMDGMFGNATSFNQDIGNWDVSNVINMSSMGSR